jgi:hypothetical protein
MEPQSSESTDEPRIDFILDHFSPVNADISNAISALATIDQHVDKARKFFSFDRVYTIRTTDQLGALIQTPGRNAPMEKTCPHVVYILSLALGYHALNLDFDTTSIPFWSTLYNSGYHSEGQMVSFIQQKFSPSTKKEEHQIIRALQRGRRFHFFHVALPGLCLVLSPMPHALDTLQYSMFLSMIQILRSRHYPRILDLASQLAEIEKTYLSIMREHIGIYTTTLIIMIII